MKVIDVAALVGIVARALGLTTREAVARLDVEELDRLLTSSEPTDVAFDVPGEPGHARPDQAAQGQVVLLAATMLSRLVAAEFLGEETVPVALLAAVQVLGLNGISPQLGQGELRAAAHAARRSAPLGAVVGLLAAAIERPVLSPIGSDRVLEPSARVQIVSARFDRAEALGLDGFVASAGYRALRQALATLSPATVRAEVLSSGLTGRSGGAAFPAGAKWATLATGRIRYLVVNADESEPGFFKDRKLMEHDPHQLLEGALLAAYAIGACLVVIYVRGEMALAQERLTAAVNDAYRHGMLGGSIFGSEFSCDAVVHPGAGAYVVGEETALLESLEGRRGFPRIKPPWYPSVRGLYGEPTIVNNVETLATLPWIIRHGAPAYAALGGGRYSGTRLFCLSGAVRRPGTYEVEMHRTSFRELLFAPDLGGGMSGSSPLSAFIPGASFPWLFPEHLDLGLDGDQVGANGSSLGGGIIVLDDQTCPVKVAWRLVRFFARESCGQCTPCREGTGWMEKVLRRIETGNGRRDDLDLLLDIGSNIAPEPFPHPARPALGQAPAPFPYRQTTICALGPSSVSPIDSSVWRYRDVYLDHIHSGACPYGRLGLVPAGVGN